MLVVKIKIVVHYTIYKDSLHAFSVELSIARHFKTLQNNNIIRKDFSMPSCCAEARRTQSQIQKLVIMSDFEAIDGTILK